MKKMRQYGVLVFVAVIFLTSNAFAQRFEYKEYTVQKGDTLWDITRAHLQDPLKWPLVWEENKKLNNPDRIYPGQKIMVPVKALDTDDIPLDALPSPDQKPMESAPVAYAPEVTPPGEETLKEIPNVIISRDSLLEYGAIVQSLPDLGEIADAPQGRTLFGSFDETYVTLKSAGTIGQKFFVVRTSGEIMDLQGKLPVGIYMWVLGTVELQEAATTNVRVSVVEFFDDILTGDKLAPYSEIFPPYVVGEGRTPSIDANVIFLKKTKKITGGFDVLFIDKGAKQDVKVGDRFYTLLPKANDWRNSVIQVVDVRDQFSLAIVKESIQDVVIGDKVVGISDQIR